MPYKTICKHINYQYKKAIQIFDNKELSMFINIYYVSSLNKKIKQTPSPPHPFLFLSMRREKVLLNFPCKVICNSIS